MHVCSNDAVCYGTNRKSVTQKKIDGNKNHELPLQLCDEHRFVLHLYNDIKEQCPHIINFQIGTCGELLMSTHGCFRETLKLFLFFKF